MKKSILLLVLFTLILATLACRLPFSGGDSDMDEEVTQEIILEEPTTSVQIEETVEETAAEDETVEAETAEAETVEAVTGGTETYSDNGVEITLPDTYMLGDAENDLAILVEGLMAMSDDEDAEDIEQLYENNKDDIIIWGYDTNSPVTHQTSLLVMKNEEFAGMSLALISAFANALFSSEVDSMQQETMTLGEREVLRFLTETENAGVETAQAIYLFNDSGKLWLIGFFTNQGQFDDRLPTFDEAAASFTVLPQE
jgi:hypothetical protein